MREISYAGKEGMVLVMRFAMRTWRKKPLITRITAKENKTKYNLDKIQTNMKVMKTASQTFI